MVLAPAPEPAPKAFQGRQQASPLQIGACPRPRSRRLRASTRCRWPAASVPLLAKAWVLLSGPASEPASDTAMGPASATASVPVWAQAWAPESALQLEPVSAPASEPPSGLGFGVGAANQFSSVKRR